MKRKYIFIGILFVLIVILGGVKLYGNTKKDTKPITTLYVAVSDDIASYINDKSINRILLNKYNLKVIYDSWDNNKIISKPLIREVVNDNAKEVTLKLQEELDINSENITKYDALLTSEERYASYYEEEADKTKGEADRYSVLGHYTVASTPLVIYSWMDVVDHLVAENVVTLDDDTYYISNPNKLFNYILNGKKWNEIGLKSLTHSINISSTDPTLSNTGASYYELLLSILSNNNIDNQSIDNNLKKLSLFYQKSGYMNNTQTGLFDRYLKTGIGGEVMIVDYEKSIIDFANINPTGFDEIKDKIVVLYPEPTINNSNCLLSFSENGQELIEAFKDEEIVKILWNKYGYRNSDNEVINNNLNIGIPSKIENVVNNLNMRYYNKMVEYLSK